MVEFFDLNFLKILKQKLKTGNRRSIHLNVLPGRYATRLELVSLNDIKEDLAEGFTHVLLNEPKFKFNISFDKIDPNTLSKEQKQKLGVISKRLNSIIYENTDNFLEHGIKTFGFGYPILIKRDKRDPSKIIKAPILIWSLDIERSKTEANKWTIIREMDFPVSINEVLISHLESDEALKIERLSEDFLEDSKIDKQELLEICTNIVRQLHPSNSPSIRIELEHNFSSKIDKVPDKDSIESITAAVPWIVWSGVLGLYRTQKESIITDIDNLIENFDHFHSEHLKIEKYRTTSIASVETDPSQQEILNSLSHHPNKIIQGPPGTGKSQSLTALISNALANQATCLVVCEKKTALDVIYENLKQSGISELCGIIEDTSKDRKRVVDSIRDRLDGQLTNEQITIESGANQTTIDVDLSFLEDEIEDDVDALDDYTALLENIKSNISALQRSHRRLSEPLFGIHNWTSLVGKFIFLNKKCSENPLIKLLDPTHFQFNVEEHNKVSRILDEGHDYFQKLGSLEHALEFLRDDFFVEENLHNAKTRIENELNQLSNNINYLKDNRDTIFKNEYVNYLGFIKNTPLRGFLITKAIKGKIEPYRFRKSSLYQSFSPLGNTVLNLLSTIGLQKFKNALNDKNWAVDHYCKLTRFFKKHGMKYDFVDLSTEFTLSDLATNIDALLISYIDLVRKSIDDFRTFYQWKHFYLSLEELQRRILIALITCEVRNWHDYFQHWYFYCILTKNEDSTLPVNDMKVRVLCNDLEKVKNLQIRNTLKHWRQRQRIAVQQFNSQNSLLTVKNLYNKRGSRGKKRNSLRKILQEDFALFTDFFPVLLLNPSVCSSLIPLKKGIFDLVIFDEASQLRLEDTFAALFRGKYKIVSGDNQQMPPSSYFQADKIVLDEDDEDYDAGSDENDEVNSKRRNIRGMLNLAESESLLEFAENLGYKESFLKIHYRSRHPYLIDFSNAAFYGNKLNPMPARHDYKPMNFIEVNGIYKNHINEDEAKLVLHILLNHIKPTKDGTYPSVGIATFNIFQRNFILDRINEEQQKSKESADRIQKLFDSGLFVKNLENIQGDERDIMILSVTFAHKENGTFSQHFGPINRKNGYRLLNVIITRAKFKVYVCCSVPPQYYNQYRELIPIKGNTGKQILYAYLAYAKAIQNNDEKTRESILGLLLENCSSEYDDDDIPMEGTESPFEDEVCSYLSKHIGPKRIEVQYRCAGFRIDLVIKSKIDNKPRIAIECDGASYHASNEAYAWDMFRQKHLETHGFRFFRIWSTNWWHDPEEETRKLVEFIKSIDAAEVQAER